MILYITSGFTYATEYEDFTPGKFGDESRSNLLVNLFHGVSLLVR